MNHDHGIASQYKAMCKDREHSLDRAQACAAVTIPSVFPPDVFNKTQDLPVPWQGLGARGVNNLASMLLLAILPPSAPFFRFKLNAEAEQLIGDDQAVKAEIDTALSMREQMVQTEIEHQVVRKAFHSALRHLLIGGNVVLRHEPKQGFKVYPLHSFVISRVSGGGIGLLILHERVGVEDLRDKLDPEEFEVISRGGHWEGSNTATSEVDMYTRVKRVDDGYQLEVEICGTVVESQSELYDLDKLPFLAPRMVVIDNEHYGRSYVEEYLGELRSLEGLRQSIVSGSAAAAKLMFLVDPAGLTDPKVLHDAPNLAVRAGRAEDVSTLQANKFADFSVARASTQDIIEGLSHAFMLAEAGIRNAERVTAEEVRLVQQALERQLGGVYTLISSEIQQPLIDMMLRDLGKSDLPKSVLKYVSRVIVTGVEALGRMADSARLDEFIRSGLETFGPQFAAHLNMSEFARRKAAALGIEHKGLVKSEEEIAQEQQAAQQAAMAEQANMKAADVVGNVAEAQMTEPQGAEQ